jgi:Holliday junction resolvase RusA-like endonuclease
MTLPPFPKFKVIAEFGFFVPGRPQPKQRARSFIIGRKRIGHYTPKATRDSENMIASIAQAAAPGWTHEPGTPLAVRMHAVFKIPASWSRKAKALAIAGKTLPTGRADVDNLAKCVLDAIQPALISNDAAVVSLVVSKSYGLEPGVSVVVQKIEAVAED